MRGADYFVSIPKRVSEALKLLSINPRFYSAFVSIPKRVSEALKHLILARPVVLLLGFNP